MRRPLVAEPAAHSPACNWPISPRYPDSSISERFAPGVTGRQVHRRDICRHVRDRRQNLLEKRDYQPFNSHEAPGCRVAAGRLRRTGHAARRFARALQGDRQDHPPQPQNAGWQQVLRHILCVCGGKENIVMHAPASVKQWRCPNGRSAANSRPRQNTARLDLVLGITFPRFRPPSNRDGRRAAIPPKARQTFSSDEYPPGTPHEAP